MNANTIKDNSLKKGSIQAMKDYFEDQIAKGNKVSQFQKALDDLDEFEKEGIKYESHKLNIDEFKKKHKELKKSLNVDEVFEDRSLRRGRTRHIGSPITMAA